MIKKIAIITFSLMLCGAFVVWYKGKTNYQIIESSNVDNINVFLVK